MNDSQPRLPPRQQLVGPDKWPLVGESGPAASDAPWQLGIHGCVANESTWSLDELQKLPAVQTTLDIHCVTRWSKYDVTFTGVPLVNLLDGCTVTDQARFVSFVARSTRAHSTSLTLADVRKLNPLVAYQVDGQPLTTDHGGPLRLITPRRYFYKSLKWLERIDVLAEERLGYWEAEAGYHNQADPWLEQRYAASQLSRRDMQTLLATRDWSDQDLRGFQGEHRQLAGLVAHRTLLRDARFAQADLSNSDFQQANLSNADFRGANLQGASFVQADLEGADFGGADLRGVDFQDASLFGASFTVDKVSADEMSADRSATRFDTRSPLSDSQIQMLTEAQQQFLAEQFND